jgi:hypothetical protein
MEGESGRVNDYGRFRLERLLQPVDHLPFVVGLPEDAGEAELAR